MSSPVWGYLRSDLQALPLVVGRAHLIGRNPKCDLALKSRSVSGEHGEIVVDDNGRQAVLRDLTSLNGCFINNIRLKGQREVLMHGDNVRFGFDSRVWTVDASKALRFASLRAQKTGGSVHILALVPQQTFNAFGGVQATIEQEARERAEVMANSAAGNIFAESGKMPTIAVRPGSPADVIRKYIDEHGNIAALVLATHAEGGSGPRPRLPSASTQGQQRRRPPPP